MRRQLADCCSSSVMMYVLFLGRRLSTLDQCLFFAVCRSLMFHCCLLFVLVVACRSLRVDCCLLFVLCC